MSSNILLLFLVVFCVEVSGAPRFIFEHLNWVVQRQARTDVIPQTSLDTPVKVSLGMSLTNIHKVDTETRSVYLDAWMNMGWNSSITFDPSIFHNLTFTRLHMSKMWLPDIAVYNGELTFVKNELALHVMQFSSGDAFWIPKTRIRVVCNVTDASLAANTTCSVRMGSWTYGSSHLFLDSNPHMDISSFDANSRYEIVQHSAVKESKKYPCCEELFETILFILTFRKR